MTADSFRTLTEYETIALRFECNLADGHAKLVPNSTGLTSASMNMLAGTSQHIHESLFLDALARHGLRLPVEGVAFFPSASLAIDAVAKFLAQEGRRDVALIEPAFDNLALLLKRAGIGITPIREDIDDIIEAVQGNDVVFICVPNNPTGWHPAAEFWPTLRRHLEHHDTLLVVDRTFRFLGRPDTALDDLVENCPLVIAIEDTGKIWSTLECKVSTVVARNAITLDKIREIGAEITLNVSPISLHLCAEAITKDHGAQRIKNVVRRNAETLMPRLAERGIVGETALSFILATIPPDFEGDDEDFVDELRRFRLAVLPVSKFYWSGGEVNKKMIRISLARPESCALRAAEIISELPERIRLTR